jgi:hypothetical protein
MLAKWGFVRVDWENAPIRGRHCLVTADSFYEWDKRKQAYCIMLQIGEPFAAADARIDTDCHETTEKGSVIFESSPPSRTKSCTHPRANAGHPPIRP